MTIPIPDLKTTYAATKSTNTTYPEDFDADNAKIIQGFEAVDSALENVLASQGVQFISDYLRKIDLADPVSWRVGGDCLILDTINTNGTFNLTNSNADDIGVAYIADRRRSQAGALSGDLNDLIASAEITDQGGGVWQGTVFIGVGIFGEFGLSLAFSTDVQNVACAIHEVDVVVTGLNATPSFTATKYKLVADGRETVWNGPTETLTREAGQTFTVDFDLMDTAREGFIYVPFEHIAISTFFYVDEDGQAYSGNYLVERDSPVSVRSLHAAQAFSGTAAEEGSETLVTQVVDNSSTERQIQSAGTLYRVSFTSFTSPTRCTVGIVVRPTFGGRPNQ